MKKVFIIVITQLLFVVSSNAQTQQELRDSITMISQLIDEHPKAVKLRLRKAALNIAMGQWQYALDGYNEVLDMMPSNLTALYYRGFVYQHMKRYAFARADYEKILKVEPLHQNALTGLILTNLYDHHNTEAFDGANRLVSLFPDSPQAYAVRSEVESAFDLIDLAIDDMEKAVALETPNVSGEVTMDDDISSYQISLFSLYIKKGERKKASRCLNYLSEHGIAKAYLSDYYIQLSDRQH